MSGVVPDLDEDARRSERRAGRVVTGDPQPFDPDVPRSCDAHPARGPPCVVDSAHVGRTDGAEADRGRPPGGGGDRQEGARVLPPDADGALKRPCETDDHRPRQPVLDSSDPGIHRCGGGAGGRVKRAVAPRPTPGRRPVRRGGVGDQAVAVHRHRATGFGREIRGGDRRSRQGVASRGRDRGGDGRRGRDRGGDGRRGYDPDERDGRGRAPPVPRRKGATDSHVVSIGRRRVAPVPPAPGPVAPGRMPVRRQRGGSRSG